MNPEAKRLLIQRSPVEASRQASSVTGFTGMLTNVVQPLKVHVYNLFVFQELKSIFYLKDIGGQSIKAKVSNSTFVDCSAHINTYFRNNVISLGVSPVCYVKKKATYRHSSHMPIKPPHYGYT